MLTVDLSDGSFPLAFEGLLGVPVTWHLQRERHDLVALGIKDAEKTISRRLVCRSG